MIVSVTVDDEACRIVEECRFMQSMLGKRTFVFTQAVTDPDDDIVNRLERRVFRYFEDQLHRIDDIELKSLVLLPDKVQLDEFLADVFPYFFEFRLQGGTARMPF